ncbi:MAG: hypothetical protein E6J71_06540 [Deltaproteobacteria bacterium]|nr:MAG: hypothetical protein E6J71_06540 [Deltaproteobacteria bacterium]
MWLRIAVLLAMLAAPPARAAFHIALIDEVMSGARDPTPAQDPTLQFVEIRMLAGFQNSVTSTRLTAFNCDGSSFNVLLQVPANVPNSGADVRWLMASPNDATFFVATGIHADFYWDNSVTGSIDPTCGMVCWGAPGFVAPNPNTWDPADPDQYTDCLAYGGYSGPRKTMPSYAGGPTAGRPTSLTPGNGIDSLTRTSNTNDNRDDFALACPTPTDNGGMTADFGACAPPTTTSTTHTTTTTLRTTTTTAPPGTDLPIPGKKLILKDDPADPAKRKLVVFSHDRSIDLGAGNGSPDDPTLGGGSFRVHTTAGCSTGGTQACDDTYNLPAGNWKLIGEEGQNKGYLYKDPALANGPIRNAAVKAGKAHVVVVSGKGAGLGDTIGADPRPVDIVLKLGAKRYCMQFGGTEKLKVGKKAALQNAPAPGACPP